MFDVGALRGALEVLRNSVGCFDPSVMHGDGAKQMVEVFSEFERLAAAGRTLALGRVEETRAYTRDGFKNAASWVAAKTGATMADGVASVEISRRLRATPRRRGISFRLVVGCSGKCRIEGSGYRARVRG